MGSPMTYSRRGDVLVVEARDYRGKVIDRWKASLNDKKRCQEILGTIAEKHGFSPEVGHERSVHAKEKTKDKEEEYNWMNMDNPWFGSARD